ncbi:MAG: hypothetical protein WB014_12705 [Methanosarcina sp.]
MDGEIAIDFTLEHPGTMASLVIANGTPRAALKCRMSRYLKF